MQTPGTEALQGLWALVAPGWKSMLQGYKPYDIMISRYLSLFLGGKMSTEALLKALPTGRRHRLGDYYVEPIPGDRYKIGGQTLSLNRAVELLGDIMPKQDAVPSEPIYPDTLRAMTCHFPYAWLMANGFKSHEYRTRKVVYPEFCLLHAGSSTKSDSVIQEFNIPESAIQRGVVIGACKIVDCDWNGDSWAYEIDEERHFEHPVGPLSGRQAIFWAPKPDSIKEIRIFNRAWQLYTAD